MKTALFRLLGLFAVPLLLVACGDLPTAPRSETPDRPTLSGGCYRGADGKTIVCPPVEPVWGDGCEEHDSSCDGDDCMASTPGIGDTSVEGCTGGGDSGGDIGDGGGDVGGGIGGGGGGGGKTPKCPDYGCPDPEDPAPEPSPTAGDIQRDTIPPSDCADPSNSTWQQLYCRSLLPDSAQASKIDVALTRIAARGETCAVVALTGRALFATGGIRFFLWQEGDDAGYGHPNTNIQMASSIVARYDPTRPDQDFEHILVHEIDHVLRLGHIDVDGWHTPHTATCGG
jgi:hypothetical protein